jgi:predicted lactoylglutathione lyase
VGREGKPELWFGERDERSAHVHVALRSPDRRTVDEFYNAALAAGGCDNGASGLRPIYHEPYYGAYVLDPDGNNIEAVCHRLE